MSVRALRLERKTGELAARVKTAPETPPPEPRGPLRPPRAEGVQVCSEDEWCVFRGAVSREPRPSLRGGNGRGLEAASGGPEGLAAGTCAVASSPAAERFQSPGGGGARPREWGEERMPNAFLQ